MLEGTLTTLPLTLIFLLCLTVMKRHEWIFLVAFSAGIILDLLTFRSIGITSLFFVSFLFLILLYQRKYETATMQFVIIASFLGSTSFLVFTGANAVFFLSIFSTMIAATAFSLYRMVNKPAEKHGGFLKV